MKYRALIHYNNNEELEGEDRNDFATALNDLLLLRTSDGHDEENTLFYQVDVIDEDEDDVEDETAEGEPETGD